jgi:hypothetical protein
MKKLVFILAIISLSQILSANPVVFSGPKINELLWDADGNWQMEIKYLLYDALTYPFDSIVLTTPNSRYKLNLPYVEGYYENFYILNRDSTENTFDINAAGDSLSICIYADGYYPPNHELIFGNFANAMVPKPETGQSIVFLEGSGEWFALDNSPTPGYANDMEGATGIISGTIYHNGQAISGSRTFCFDFYFTPEANGAYQASCLPGERTLTQIGRADQWEDGEQWFTIEPVNITIEREESYQHVDIVITDSSYVGINENLRSDVLCYPNPTSNLIHIKGTFAKETIGQLLNVKGALVQTFMLDASSGNQSFELNKSLLPGIYILTILEQNKPTYKQKIIVNPFK